MDALREMIRNVEELASTDRNLDFQISVVRLVTTIMIILAQTLYDARGMHETNEYYERLCQNVVFMVRDLGNYYQYLNEEEILITVLA